MPSSIEATGREQNQRAASSGTSKIRLGFLVLSSIAIAGIVLLWLQYDGDIAEQRARVSGHSSVVALPTGRFEYAELGSGEPVLAIHGSGGGFDQGLEMVGPLAGAGYRLIAPSRFGYLGSSFPENASPALQADTFAAFLDALGIRDIFVVGGSAGALSAMQFAIRHPDRCRALVLYVPAVYAPTRRPNTSSFEGPVQVWMVRTLLRSDFLFWLAITVAPDTMTRTLLATEPAIVHAQPKEERDRISRVLWHILPVGARAEGLMLDMKTAGAPEAYPLDQIKCPVLAISAKDDLFGTAASAAYTAANVPNGKAVIYETGGHILAGRDTEASREVSAFLAATAGHLPAENDR
jgi:pimeloyl-ACP methyl ester carboxylesterase